MHQVQSYLGNPNVKKDGVVQEWTSDLVDEYARCMKDPSYFAEKYCKIIVRETFLTICSQLLAIVHNFFRSLTTMRFVSAEGGSDR